jgi:regulator of sigma E protease
VSFLYAFLALGLLILVHEAGHMWMARLCGMRVDKFSIFFGPALLRWRGKQTTYQLATVPLGGYVQIAGMNPSEQLPPDDTGSYQHKSAWRRFLTVAAGPSINYLFAIVIMLTVLLVWGLPVDLKPARIGDVVSGKAAAAAGLKSEDQVIAIDGNAIDLQKMLKAIKGSGGKTLVFRIERQGKLQDINVTPRKKTSGKGYEIGVSFLKNVKFHNVSFGKALLASVYYPVQQSGKILAGLKKMVEKRKDVKVGGPIAIVMQLKMSFEHSFVMALLFIAMLNVYLGLFNLLPLPALDGGRMVFLLVEMISRRQINQRIETMVHTAGFLLLVGLLLLVTYGDIASL